MDIELFLVLLAGVLHALLPILKAAFSFFLELSKMKHEETMKKLDNKQKKPKKKEVPTKPLTSCPTSQA